MIPHIQKFKLNKNTLYISDNAELSDNSSEELGDIVRISRFKEKATSDRTILDISMELEWEIVVEPVDGVFNISIKIHNLKGKVIYEDWEPNIPEVVDDLLDIFSDGNDREYDDDEMDLVKYTWNLDTGDLTNDSSEWKCTVRNTWHERAKKMHDGIMQVEPDYVDIDIAKRTIYVDF